MSKLTIPVCQICNKQVLFNRFGDTNTISLFDNGVDIEEIKADNLDNFCSCKIADRKIKYASYNPKYNNKISINKETYPVYRGYFVNIQLNDSNTDYVICQCGGILIDVLDFFAKNHYIWCEKCNKIHFINRIESEELNKFIENKFSLVKDLNDEIDNIETEGFETEGFETEGFETDSKELKTEDNIIKSEEYSAEETQSIFGNNSYKTIDYFLVLGIKSNINNLRHIIDKNIDNKYFINNKNILVASMLGLKLNYHCETMTNIFENVCKTDFDLYSIAEYEFKILNSDTVNIIGNNTVDTDMILTKLIQVIDKEIIDNPFGEGWETIESRAEDKVIGYILVEQKLNLSSRTISKYTLSEVSKFTIEKSLKMKNTVSLCKAYTKISLRTNSNVMYNYDTSNKLNLPQFGSKQDRENRSLKVCPNCRKVKCDCEQELEDTEE